MVVISAAILTLASVGLKPFQDKNIRVEKMQQLLIAVGIESDAKNAEELYNKYFTEELAINGKGEIISNYTDGEQVLGDIRPFEIDLKSEIDKNKRLEDLTQSEAILPLYVYKDGEKKIFVIPVMGNGLWGGVWGNIALDEDLNTIYGVNFDHKGETPGLGAEISEREFANQFTATTKQIFSDGEFRSVELVKGADKNNPHQVDAISGGTITSNGVSDMIRDCLKFYIPFIKSLNN